MLNDALSRQIVQRLDQLETGLIQHVRTSALKKEREVFLIDEVLEIRKLRKQSHCYFTKKIESLQSDNEELQARSDGVFKDFLASQQRVASQSKALEAEFSSRARIAQEAKAEEIGALRQKYENKLVRLESKLREVQEAQGRREDSLLSARAQAIANEAAAVLRKEHDESIARYREAFRVLAEKESSLLLKVRDQAAALATSEESSSRLRAMVDKLERVVLEAKAKRDAQDKEDSRHRLADVQRAHSLEIAEQARRMEELRTRQSDEVDRLRAEHATQLRSVDDRVRSALAAKDDSIAGLQRRVHELETKQRDADNVLRELYAEASLARR